MRKHKQNAIFFLIALVLLLLIGFISIINSNSSTTSSRVNGAQEKSIDSSP